MGFQHQAQAEMWGSSAQIDRTARTYTGSSIIAHAAQTRICPHTHSSGPLKLDARLLLYTVAATKYSLHSSGAKQLTCEFSIVLLGSSSVEGDPAITCPILRL